MPSFVELLVIGILFCLGWGLILWARRRFRQPQGRTFFHRVARPFSWRRQGQFGPGGSNEVRRFERGRPLAK